MQGSHDGFVRRIVHARRGALRAAAIIAAIAILAPTIAVAAETSGAAKGSDAIFIAELGLLLLVGRLMGEAAQRLGQPAVMGQLIGGLLLGPSVLGLIWPSAQHLLFPGVSEQKSMIGAVSEVGILMLLLLTGMETDLQLVKRVGRAAVTVAAAGVALPFACGFALGEFLPAELLPKPDARLVTSIFLGTALSISSVKIVAMVVRDMNFMRRDLGQIIVASAILEDTIGWVIIAIAFGLASAGTVDLWTVARAIIGTALFMVFSFTIGRRIVFDLIRWTNDYFESEFAVITVILLIMIGMALITDWIGVKDVLGAFVAGILVGESPILTRHIDEQLRGIITALFMPVFFGLAGLSADLTVLQNPELALLTVGLILIASVGKFTGAFVGGTIGGLSRAESLALGCGMNARGSTEVIVATVGLSMGVLSQNLFTLIVTMAILTTLAMPPMLRWALRRLPLNRKERQRLKREELDVKGFVVNLERLLLATDDSANGKFASRLAGVIAGSGGKPTTILEFKNGQNKKKSAKTEDKDADPAETKADSNAAHDVKNAAKDVTTLDAHPDGEKPGKVEVTRRSQDSAPHEAVAEEATRGYDLLIVGIGKTHDPKGGFAKDVSSIATKFEGPVVVVDTHVAKGKDIRERGGRILLPINGSEVSRRAAEVALVLARASDAHVTALFVTRTTPSGDRRKAGLRKQAARRNEQAVLKDIAAVAERYGVTVRNTTITNASPDEAILREAKRGYDLIVLGVSRRPGDTLYFGNTASSILDNSTTSNLFVAS
jgi:Kef-type K+ transport system membrane component KefB/nucleotide-binding universal stress UspA family protein